MRLLLLHLLSLLAIQVASALEPFPPKGYIIDERFTSPNRRYSVLIPEEPSNDAGNAVDLMADLKERRTSKKAAGSAAPRRSSA